MDDVWRTALLFSANDLSAYAIPSRTARRVRASGGWVRRVPHKPDEVDAAQAKGELAKQGGRHSKAPRLGGLIDDRRLAEWRAVRDAGIVAVERPRNSIIASPRPG